MDSEIREKIKDIVLTEEEKNKLKGGASDWPVEYVVPPEHSDSDRIGTLYKDPSNKYDGKFYMPPPEHDFECHECGGRYGPWVHTGFQINVDGGHGSKPIYANILQERNRWCEECGYKFHNAYAVGKVYFERDKQGILSFDHWEEG